MFNGFFSEFALIAVLNTLFLILVIVAILIGIRWLMRQSNNDRRPPDGPPDDTALELLRQRFARGEIDATEFEERKRTLGG
ncbi:MAG TPA: SHOCT domain-containing protein [Candidatus Limnocylindrales bacterium]|nr:SHOCT domain-containing protein [Candidatus Limnocylindrales bacterium]